MNDREFEDLKTDIAALLGPFIRPGDIDFGDLRETRENLEEWYNDDSLEFGIWAVEAALEEAGIPREERLLVSEEVKTLYPELEQ